MGLGCVRCNKGDQRVCTPSDHFSLVASFSCIDSEESAPPSEPARGSFSPDPCGGDRAAPVASGAGTGCGAFSSDTPAECDGSPSEAARGVDTSDSQANRAAPRTHRKLVF